MEESKKIKDKKRRENSQGITLIALVITIIVLLILAGVSFAMLTGENGILIQATNAKEKTDKTTEEEKVQMAVLGSSIIDNGYAEVLDTDSFKQELQNQFGSQSLDVVVNGDGSFIITVEDTQRKYYVNDDKTVINSDNILEISTAEEFASFRDDVNSGNSYEGKAVVLTDNITLDSSVEWEPIGYYEKTTDEKNPDTTTNKAFKGIFDGNNKEINGITINSTNEICHGLFGLVIDGTIRNVVIGKNNNISGKEKTAGVVGYLYGFKGNISNCVNYSDIIGGVTTGGIIGIAAGQHTIYNCKNYGNIIGRGGIVGNSNGTSWEVFQNVSNEIINCGNYGEIKSHSNDEYYYGGITGYFKGNIFNSCNKGKIVGSLENTGGIVGTLDGKIEKCYNLGEVSGQNCVGGIIGTGGDTLGVDIYDSYTVGTISGNNGRTGEINGSTYGVKEIKNCYTKDDTFTAADLGDAFKEDTENVNGGYPLLYWE